MSISPRDPQTRLALSKSLSQHDQRCAATLVNLQIWSTAIIAAATIGVDIDIDTDVIRGSTATAAANVAVTLPPGSPEIIGHVYEAEKTNSDAYTFGFACAGSDTFDDAATSFAQATQFGTVRTYWNGTVWRKLAAGATGGALPPASSGVLGDGTGSPSLTMNKSAGGTDSIALHAASVLRGLLQLTAAEDLVISVYDTDGVTLLGSLTFNHTTGALTSSKGVTVTSGGLVVTAGGATITAGGLTVTAGGLALVAGNMILTSGVRLVGNVPSAADDAAAAALSPTVPVGGLYHTAGAVKQRLA